MRSFIVTVWGFVELMCLFLMLNDFKRIMAFHKVSKHLQHINAFQVLEDHKPAYHFQPKHHWINGMSIMVVFATNACFSILIADRNTNVLEIL
ncbi:putative beta-fructofuranosidase [Helianthus annuus]|nr:putative beta-fructofuranosidase [Helianthus annuus]